jgi:aminoglycoside 6-adenylyltransferase
MKDKLDAVEKQLTEWAERRPDVRAVILTSSRSNPDAVIDEFSDYDIILAVTDIQPYLKDESWLEDFGKVLVLYRDPVEVRFGYERFIRVTQYESGLKIDFTLWPVALLKHVAAMVELPDYIDDGYKVLLDKDGLTRSMKAPSFRAFIPEPPTEREYRQFVEEFFSNAPYVAKHIRRGDLFPLKAMLDFMRHEKLRRMLEWQVEIAYNWSIKSGQYGKGLQKYLAPEILREIENTYAGTGPDADWESLFRIIVLFRKVAKDVGQHLGYTYPGDIDSGVVKYLYKVKGMKLRK